ncbi:hypothetical protein [Pontibaca methylaminivorans]|uniref:Apolipoprotein D and lipocalin family protein n=1 Tax=Pontibaca methylaminivorans TaxID=515897 RepID=A0A1R3X2A8_9RHOB|nr:hypothetical protein [Pontibaca methylaminivorans]SIT85042.1 apolipoprotein D and lipocalin family protein [Pontibaca methylaminivorans]
MRRLLLLALVALAGCSAPFASRGYRDTGAPIGATSRFDAARFAGTYRVVAEFAPDNTRALRRTLRFEQGDGGLVMRDGLRTVPLAVVGPGRLRPAGAGTEQDIWVLWGDADDRTAVLGTPSGAFGMIIERGNGAADRMQAAREILEWYGYDLAHLVWLE